MKKRSEQIWVFRFILESEDGQKVDQDVPESLLDHIIDWVEKRGYQIGGGYRPPTFEELNDDGKPLFPLK